MDFFFFVLFFYNLWYNGTNRKDGCIKMNKNYEVERSIITNYRKKIWRPFMKAIRDYELIKENDKVAVCISGGKDSFMLAKCMQELQKHGKVPFSLEFIVMDPGYKKENRELIEENAKTLEIPIHIFETDIFEVVHGIENSPCYLCARMRRGNLYSFAKSLGCNKIALGHHFDDVIETVLLSMFYGSEFKTMMPKLKSTNFEGMELIRPLYLVREKDIISFFKSHELRFLNCACRFTEESSRKEDLSKRKEIKHLIEKLHEVNPNVENNIFKSTDRVNLSTVLGYRKDDEEISFLDWYDDKK